VTAETRDRLRELSDARAGAVGEWAVRGTIRSYTIKAGGTIGTFGGGGKRKR
jgi:hypothetical protein